LKRGETCESTGGRPGGKQWMAQAKSEKGEIYARGEGLTIEKEKGNQGCNHRGNTGRRGAQQGKYITVVKLGEQGNN